MSTQAEQPESAESLDLDSRLPWDFEYTPQSLVRRPFRLIREMGTNAWKGRGLAYRLFLRNLNSVYRQTLLGFLWILIPTFALVGTWMFLARNKVVAQPELEGSVYIAFVAIGTVLWQAFFSAVQAPLRTVLANQSILTRINFPRESLILVALAEVLFDIAIRMTVVLIICSFLGIQWSWLTLWAPLVLLNLIALGISIGMFLTPIGVIYQDVSRVLMLISPFWMVLTPVLYASPSGQLFETWNLINPPAGQLLVLRDLLLSGATAQWHLALPWFFITIPLLIISLAWYRIGFPFFIERLAN